jgi:hypothetical protein
VDAYHSFIAQRFEEMNNLLKGTKERQPSKKRTNPFERSIFKKKFIKDSFKKKMCHRKNF